MKIGFVHVLLLVLALLLLLLWLPGLGAAPAATPRKCGAAGAASEGRNARPLVMPCAAAQLQ